MVHGAGDIRLLFKLLLKYRNVLKLRRAEVPLLVIKLSKKISPQRWRFSFALKRNDMNSPGKHSRNARVISAEELGTMSKNNLRRITLDIGPILGIHSLALIISWLECYSHILQHFTRLRKKLSWTMWCDAFKCLDDDKKQFFTTHFMHPKISSSIL